MTDTSSLIVATEARLFRAPDGTLWSLDKGRSYHFWTRYLSVFRRVIVVARVVDSTVWPGTTRVDGSGVEVWALPDFKGLSGYLRRRTALVTSVAALLRTSPGAAVLSRVPGLIGSLVARTAATHGRGYHLEFVGDPAAVALSGVLHGPLRLVRRLIARRVQRDYGKLARRSQSVAYVTQRHLQSIYPPLDSASSFWVSDVDLPESAFRRPAPRRDAEFRLVTVGSLEQPYKGIDQALRAIALIPKKYGAPAPQLTVVGGGRLLSELRGLAARLGLDSTVTFVGHVETPERVRNYLDEADAYVQASLTEGMPRALLEAMARGLPCIATDVGGTRELVMPEALVDPGDPVALAQAIHALSISDALRVAMAEQNFERSKAFAADARREREVDWLTGVHRLHTEASFRP